MLSKVSWSQYLICIGIVLFVYYVFVILVYYRKELSGTLSSKFKKSNQLAEEGLAGEAYPEDQSFDELEMVVNDLRYAILDPAGKNANKQEVLVQLKNRLADYEGMGRPAFRVSINNYIIQHAKEICGVVFSEEELEAEWGILPR